MGREAASHVPTCPQIFGLAWSPDGQQLATVCKDGRLRIYEPRGSSEPLQVSRMAWGRPSDLVGVPAKPHMLYPNRKAQGPRGPVEPALCGCVTVTISWCQALTGEDSGIAIPIPRPQHPLPSPQDTHTPVKCAAAVPTLTYWMDGWVDRWMDGWMNGWMDEWVGGEWMVG